ncbi:stage II sporulation protein P [Sporolactobacillus sp. THM7-4]|nr:stage II sporulation protein P [Sporolactobacillus sp. THM7-4]
MSNVKIGLLDGAIQQAEWPAETVLRETFGNENVLFNHAAPSLNKPKNIYHLILEAVTDIRFDDVRSLFGSELPGFTLYNTKIFIAGKGLNYTNLPKESPPPPEIILEAPAPERKHKNAQPSVDQKLKKVVLLYHTHSWESYKPALAGGNHAVSAVSADPDLDVIQDGTEIGNVLADNGIGYVHDESNKTVGLKKHGWGYNEAYQYSRSVVQSNLKKNPDLTYLIDIHRDSSGRKFTTTSINSVSYARISFIIGEDNPNYSANLYLAKQIKDLLDKRYPGLVRGIIGKTKNDGNGVYNQDLSKNALLIEIGGVDNSLAEVDRSSRAFAEALSTFIKERKK